MSFLRTIRINLGRWLLGNEIAVLESKLDRAQGDNVDCYNLYLKTKAERDAALSTVDTLRNRVEELQNKVPDVQYALHRDTFNKKIVEKLEHPMINSTTTNDQVGYLLGIQRALRVVERELVIG